MKTEILTNDYIDGKRVTTQKITYTMADDINTLGQLQISLARVLNAIDALPQGKSNAQYDAERDRLTSAIAAQKQLVDAYDA